jgi:hypothetical protein
MFNVIVSRKGDPIIELLRPLLQKHNDYFRDDPTKEITVGDIQGLFYLGDPDQASDKKEDEISV